MTMLMSSGEESGHFLGWKIAGYGDMRKAFVPSTPQKSFITSRPPNHQVGAGEEERVRKKGRNISGRVDVCFSL